MSEVPIAPVMLYTENKREASILAPMTVAVFQKRNVRGVFIVLHETNRSFRMERNMVEEKVLFHNVP